jgi:dynein heavy chain
LELQKAVKGLIVMSAELELCGRTLVIGQVPAMWIAKSYPSRKPLASYVTDLIERVAFLQNWITNGMPIVYWLSVFFFTQSFLTGAKQNYARNNKIPIDTVDFEFEVREKPVSIMYYTLYYCISTIIKFIYTYLIFI